MSASPPDRPFLEEEVPEAPEAELGLSAVSPQIPACCPWVAPWQVVESGGGPCLTSTPNLLAHHLAWPLDSLTHLPPASSLRLKELVVLGFVPAHCHCFPGRVASSSLSHTGLSALRFPGLSSPRSLTCVASYLAPHYLPLP